MASLTQFFTHRGNVHRFQMSDGEENVIVVDNGMTIKAGFAGFLAPTAIFPALVSRPHLLNRNLGTNDCYVGDEWEIANCTYEAKFPIERRIVTDWDDMVKIWHHAFYKQLRVAPEEHPVLMSDSPWNPKADREKMTEIMFETFETPAFYLQDQATLSLYSTGRTSGIVLDWGDQIAHIVPIREGCMLPHATLDLDFGGIHLTHYLMRLLNERGHFFKTRTEHFAVHNAKEELCYVAKDFEQEIRTAPDIPALERCFQLSNKGKFSGPLEEDINMSHERFKCPEALFQPSLLNLRRDGIHKRIHKAIEMSPIGDVDFRPELYGNIVLAGGTTLFPGFADRLRQELASLAPEATKIEIVATQERGYSAWLGGSIVGSLTSFPDMCMSKDEYAESGPSMIHRK